MIFRQVPVGTFQNFAYIIGDETTRVAALVDPAWEVERLLQLCGSLGLTVTKVINTHSHPDHVQGNDQIAEQTGAKIVMHEKSRLKKDVAVKDGDIIEIGSLKARVIHTPGHCQDHICILIENKLLTGDTLFVGECGRTDLPGSNPGEMYDSLFQKILPLQDSIEIYPGHNYGQTTHTTIGNERRNNYTLKTRTRDEFIKFMSQP